jgi:phosphatidylethanolamine-binding protein (PEBP) family uncharacterized protein
MPPVGHGPHRYCFKLYALDTHLELKGGNPQSYCTTARLRKLTVLLDYYEAMETYSRIGLLRGYENLQSYWTTTKLWKLTVVLDCYEAMETCSGIGPSCSGKVDKKSLENAIKGHVLGEASTIGKYERK